MEIRHHTDVDQEKGFYPTDRWKWHNQPKDKRSQLHSDFYFCQENNNRLLPRSHVWMSRTSIFYDLITTSLVLFCLFYIYLYIYIYFFFHWSCHDSAHKWFHIHSIETDRFSPFLTVRFVRALRNERPSLGHFSIALHNVDWLSAIKRRSARMEFIDWIRGCFLSFKTYFA